MDADTSISAQREMEYFASHSWSGESSTMALLVRRDSKTSPTLFSEGNKHFLRSCFPFLTLSRTACQLQRDMNTVSSFLVTEWPCYSPWSASKPCSGQERSLTWWLPKHAYLCVSRTQQTQADLTEKGEGDITRLTRDEPRCGICPDPISGEF